MRHKMFWSLYLDDLLIARSPLIPRKHALAARNSFGGRLIMNTTGFDMLCLQPCPISGVL